MHLKRTTAPDGISGPMGSPNRGRGPTGSSRPCAGCPAGDGARGDRARAPSAPRAAPADAGAAVDDDPLRRPRAVQLRARPGGELRAGGGAGRLSVGPQRAVLRARPPRRAGGGARRHRLLAAREPAAREEASMRTIIAPLAPEVEAELEALPRRFERSRAAISTGCGSSRSSARPSSGACWATIAAGACTSTPPRSRTTYSAPAPCGRDAAIRT